MLRDFLILSRVQLRALAYSLAPRKRGGGSDHGRTLRLMGVGVGLALLALLAVVLVVASWVVSRRLSRRCRRCALISTSPSRADAMQRSRG